MKLGETQFIYTPLSADDPPDSVYHCGVCGQEMLVDKEVYGPRNMADAITGHKEIHNAWVCPDAYEEWHGKVVSCRRWIRDCPSGRLRKIVEDEIKSILQANLPK